MQFLLAAINAKYIHSNPAIYSLRAYAGEEYADSVSLAEYTINNRPEEILADLYKRKPDAIGFSCYIWNWEMIKLLLKELPKVLPQTDLWLGGPEVSFNPQEIMEEFPMLKGIMLGEGEDTFRELIACYEQTLANIPGLYLKSGCTQEREPIEIDSLPFYYDDLEAFENRIIYYESSRGCPFRCSYCLSSIDKKVRLRSFEKVKKELRFFLDKRAAQVKFVDRTFNCSREHALQIWSYLLEHDNGVTNFHFEIAADLLEEEELSLLARMRPGLVQLEIGVQSTNQQTLEAINRKTDIDRIKEIVERINSNKNIHVHLDLIVGLPYEDYESFQKSFNDVYHMRPQQLQLGFLKVLKGSPIAGQVKEFGIVYQERSPYEVLYTKWISYEQVLRLKRIEEMVELYYNSNQFRHMLPVLEQEFEDAFSMFDALGEYYERKGYFLKSPARARRYEVLLEFACEKNGEKRALYQELLTFDFYLREKPGSRPVYALDVNGFRDHIWQFYQQEEEQPRYLKDYEAYHARQTMKMTHLEPFFYPVWKEETGEVLMKMEKPEFVLFDYQKRDPLTGDGTYRCVNSEALG